VKTQPSSCRAPETREEQIILFLVYNGLSDREIARICGVSHRTVHWHLAVMRLRYGVNNRVKLVTYAQERGWFG